MSLRVRILLILAIVASIYTFLNFSSHHMIIFPSYVLIEQDEARKDIKRCVDAIQREIYRLNVLCYNRAVEGNTYQFVLNKGSEYIERNLGPRFFVDNNLNVIYIINDKREVVWGEIIDPVKKKTIQMDDFPSRSFSKNHQLLASNIKGRSSGIDNTIKGIFMTKRGPMIIASCPIIPSESTGPVRGTLIMGRFLNNDAVAALKKETGVDFQLWSISGGSIPEGSETFLKRITVNNPYIIHDRNEKLLEVYAKLSDLQESPALLIRADIPRDITARGNKLMKLDMLSVVVSGLLVLIIWLILFQKVIVDPITKLTKHIMSMGENSNLSSLPSIRNNDDIGKIATAFDHMAQQLTTARKKLLEESYYSGISEMATGVLHNVRNALSPMITQIDALCRGLHESPIEEIERAKAELAGNNLTNTRRKELTRFLELAHQSLVSSSRERKNKLSSLVGLTMQIEEILDEQERFSRANRPIEEFSLYQMMHDSEALLPDELRRIVHVHIDRNIEEFEPITTYKLPLLQVFANLLFNAGESIKGSGTVRGKIQIHGEKEKIDNVDMIHLQICDNGEGIEPDKLEKIFDRGFTTKHGKSSGIGLYWCANTFTAIRGKLYAKSEGKGRGACFHVLIPQNPGNLF